MPANILYLDVLLMRKIILNIRNVYMCKKEMCSVITSIIHYKISFLGLQDLR